MSETRVQRRKRVGMLERLRLALRVFTGAVTLPEQKADSVITIDHLSLERLTSQQIINILFPKGF